MMKTVALLSLLVGICLATFAPNITEPGSRSILGSFRFEKAEGTLYSIEATGYDVPFLLINVTAPTYKQAGFIYGKLLSKQIEGSYTALTHSLFPNQDLRDVLELFVAWQYEDYISKHLPQKYKDEIAGMAEGAADAGNTAAYFQITNAVSLSSIATGDVSSDIMYLLEAEFKKNTSLSQRLQHQFGGPAEVTKLVASSVIFRMGRSCSMFGAFNSRTVGGNLFSGRNLDWAADTGVSDYKILAVYHLADEVPYVALSFAGAPIALSGMSAAGITVHEAGNDNKLETLEGFAWGIRLRELMATTRNLHEAQVFWNSTNNTMGLNHGIGSASDKRFIALETKPGYSAIFTDGDGREAAYTYQGQHMGFPLKDAIWRTNHGYDPEFLSTAVDDHPGHDTYNRYLLLHDTFEWYRTSGQLISDAQAVNLTAIVGDKGGSSRDSFLSCSNASSGVNVLSVAFAPSSQVMYVAYEAGRHENHVPGCCGYYVKFDMSEYF